MRGSCRTAGLSGKLLIENGSAGSWHSRDNEPHGSFPPPDLIVTSIREVLDAVVNRKKSTETSKFANDSQIALKRTLQTQTLNFAMKSRQDMPNSQVAKATESY